MSDKASKQKVKNKPPLPKKEEEWFVVQRKRGKWTTEKENTIKPTVIKVKISDILFQPYKT